MDEVRAMDIPFARKIELLLEYKLEQTSQLSHDFIEELLQLDFDVSEWYQHFIEFLLEGQRTGDVRGDIRPEFIFAVLDKLHELGRDEELMQLYPDYRDLTRELHHLLFYGILSREQTEANSSREP